MKVELFQQEMKKKIKHLFKADEYHFEHISIDIDEDIEHDIKIQLEQDAYYYLANSKLDIPITVALYLSSECNFLTTSKTEWEFDDANDYRLETFRNYIHVRTENATIPFKFKLHFIKVTPYRL